MLISQVFFVPCRVYFIDMAQNNLDVSDMLRERYSSELQYEFQKTASDYLPFVTQVDVGNAREYVWDGIGSFETDYLQQKYQTRESKEAKYSKRSFGPVSVNLSLMYSQKDVMRQGAFNGPPAGFMENMVYAFQRRFDEVIAGVVKQTILGKKRFTIAPSPASVPEGFYAGGALAGITGTMFTGADLKTPETMPLHAALNDGTIASGYSVVTRANLDLETTNIIPHDYTASGSFTPNGFNKEKVLALREAMETRNVLNPGDIMNIAITPAMKYQMIRDKDLWDLNNGFQTLKKGLFDELHGIRFLVTNCVPWVNIAGKTATGETEDDKWVLACPAWRTQDLKFGMWEDLEMFAVDYKQNGTWDKMEIAAQCSLGAGRESLESAALVLCDMSV